MSSNKGRMHYIDALKLDGPVGTEFLLSFNFIFTERTNHFLHPWKSSLDFIAAF